MVTFKDDSVVYGISMYFQLTFTKVFLITLFTFIIFSFFMNSLLMLSQINFLCSLIVTTITLKFRTSSFMNCLLMLKQCSFISELIYAQISVKFVENICM